MAVNGLIRRRGAISQTGNKHEIRIIRERSIKLKKGGTRATDKAEKRG